MNRRLCGLSGLKLLPPEFLVVGLVRSVLLAVAGREDEAHATMQRYLANDKAPFRTMSEWRASWAVSRCSLGVHVFLFGGKISQMASGKLGCRSKRGRSPRRRGDRDSGSLHVSYGSISTKPPVLCAI
jgi:hypothetical protein